jgi:hypothetical protein
MNGVRYTYLLAVVIALSALGIRLFRPDKPTDLGWKLVRHLERGNAVGISRMFPDEELEMIGVSREQAAVIVRELVLPEANELTRNVVAVTRFGHNVVLERPKGDAMYVAPPMVVVREIEPGRYTLGLGDLLASVWGFRKQRHVLGLSEKDPTEQILRDWEQLRLLGYEKTMDWTKREAVPVPARPVGY